MNKLTDLIGGAFARRGPANLHGNAIHVIAPYRHHGMWVFDDARVDLHQEPFVSGADDWITRVAEQTPGAENGFVLVFSARPFPGHDLRLARRRLDMGGAWYWSDRLQMEGWLCSALFRYFPSAPAELYVQLKPKA